MADDANPYAATVGQMYGGSPTTQPDEQAAPPPPAKRLRDMDGTDLGADTSAGPLLREPVDPSAEQATPPPLARAAGQPENPYAATVAQLYPKDGQGEDDTASRWMDWRARNPQFDPAQAADVLRYAEASGKPVDFVAKNLDAVRGSVDASKVDLAGLAQTHPALHQQLASSGLLIDGAKDDLGPLTQLEDAVHAPHVGEALRDSLREQQLNYLEVKDWAVLGGPESEQRIGKLEGQLAGAEKDYGATSIPGRVLVGTAKMVPMVVGDMLARALGKVTGSALGRLGGAAAGAAAGAPEGGAPAVPGAVAGGAGGAVVGGVVGQELASGAFNSYQVLGPLHRELQKARGPAGEQLDPDVERLLSVNGAMVGGGLTALLGGPIGNRLAKYGGGQSIKELADQGMVPALRAELQKDGVISALNRLGRRWGAHELSGAVVMALQSAVNDATAQAGNLLNGGEFDGKRLVGNTAHSFIQGLIDMPLMALGHAGQETVADERDRASVPIRAALEEKGQQVATVQGQDRLQALIGAVKASTSAEGMPTQVRELVKASADQPAGVQAAYIHRDSFDKLAQAQKADPAELAKAVFGSSEPYEQSTESGDLAVPIEDYVAAVKKHGPIVEQLAQEDTRLYQPDRSPREQREADEALQSRAAELAKAAPEAMGDEQRQVYEDFRDKALAAGRGEKEADANGKLVAAAMQSWAEKFQKNGSKATALDLYRMQDVAIRGPAGAGIDSPLMRGLRARYEALPQAEQRQRLYVDRLTGLHTESGYEARAPDPARPFTTEVQVAQSKAVNDQLGHDAGDNVLKVFGNTLKAGGISDAVRRGNTVSFDSKTQEEADQLVRQMKEALGGHQVVTSGTVRAAEGESPADRLQRARFAHEDRRAAGRESGALPARDAKLTDEQKAGLAPLLENPPRPASATVTPAHEADFERVARERDLFTEANLTPEGLLNENGFRLAVEHLEANLKPGQKLHFLSADVRGVGKLNEAFSKGLAREDRLRPVDEIMSEAAKHIAKDPRAKQFFIARPHGDEFYAVHVGGPKELDALQRFFHSMDKELADSPFYRQVGDQVVSVKGLRVAFGTAETFKKADRDALKQAKELQDREGKLIGPEPLDAAQWRRAARGFTRRTGHEPVRVGQGLREEVLGEAGSVRRDGGRGGSGAGGGGDGPAGPGGTGGLGGGAAGEAQGQGAQRANDGHSAAEVALDQPTFELQSKRGRGSITFTAPEGGKRRRFNIELLRGADPSTLAHETAHFLGEVMGDLAQRPDAPAGIKDDYAGLLKFMGYDSHEERQAARAERATLKTATGAAEKRRLAELTAKEERLSHAWEQYLMEGKTPSVALAGVFQRFSNWMVRIYRNVRSLQAGFVQNFGESIGLSDDVRRIFDRLLASTDEVERMQKAQSAQPFHEPFADATPEERAAYEKQAAAAGAEANSEMLRRIIAAQKVESNEYFTDERQRFRDEVNGELDTHPVYKALSALQTGTEKLDRAALVKKYGAEFVRSMPRGIFAEKGKGTSADELASVHGFDDGDALVRALQASAPRRAVVESQVEERMRNIYGQPLLDNAKALDDAALDALHNPEAMRAALLEHRRLAAKLDPERARRLGSIDEESLRRTARRLVADIPVGRIVRGDEGQAGVYRRAERVAAERMRKAYEAGKVEEAVGHNTDRLLNMALWREARDARSRIETEQNLLRQARGEAWQTTLGKADVAATEGTEKASDRAYRGTTNALLQAVGVMEAPAGGIDTAPLDTLVKAVGEEPLGDVQALRELLADPRPWKDLSQQEATAVADAVKSIRHAAGRQVDFEVEGKRIEKAQLYAEMTAIVAKSKTLPAQAFSKSGRTAGEIAAAGLRSVDAWLTPMDRYVDEIDGGDRNGPAHRVLMDERLRARDMLVGIDKKVTAKVIERIDALPQKLRDQAGARVPGLAELLPIPDRFKDRVRPPETRQELWTLYLNAGNRENLQRLRDGNGWSEDQVNKALQLLSPEEVEFLQGLLDTIDSLHPDLARVYEGRTGLPLGKVDATPIRVHGKDNRGGYFPIRYHSSIDRRGVVQLADVEKMLFPQGLATPSVFSGHTKSRVERVDGPLSLDFGTVGTHLAQVTQDIAMGDWVRRAGAFVLDQRFQDLSAKRLGEERTKLWGHWLRDIANERAGSSAAAASGTPGMVESSMAMGRSLAIKSVMALNLPSTMAHLTDALVAVGDAQGVEAKARRAALLPEAYAKTLAAMKPGAAPRPEWALSQELRFRESRELVNVRKELAKVRLPPNSALRGLVKVQDAVDHVSTVTRHNLDVFHSRILFQMGYEEGLDRGMPEAEAARHGDDLVSRTLPSGDLAEKSAILRSKSGFGQIASVLYGYANKMYGLFVHAPLARASDAGWSAASVGDLAASWLTMGAIEVLGGYLGGRRRKEEDEKARLFGEAGDAGWIARRVLMAPLNTIPILGMGLEQLVDGREVSVRTAPEAQLVQDSLNRIGKTWDRWRNGEASDDDWWSIVEGAAAGTLGVYGQGRRTFGYLDALRRGELGHQDAADVAGGLIYGPPR